jgi:hypothetical protein
MIRLPKRKTRVKDEPFIKYFCEDLAREIERVSRGEYVAVQYGPDRFKVFKREVPQCASV